MRIGRLNTKATLSKPTRTTNSFGEDELTWTNYASAWIEIVDSRSTEFVQFAQTKAQTTHVIKMRFMRGVDSSHRISYSDGGTTRTLNIVGVVNVANRNRELMVNAVEVTNG